MALTSRTVSVGTTATRLDKVADAHLTGAVALYNAGAAIVYVGGSDVTTANGYPVGAGSYGPGVELAVDESLYGIVASGTCDVRVLEVGV